MFTEIGLTLTAQRVLDSHEELKSRGFFVYVTRVLDMPTAYLIPDLETATDISNARQVWLRPLENGVYAAIGKKSASYLGIANDGTNTVTESP